MRENRSELTSFPQLCYTGVYMPADGAYLVTRTSHGGWKTPENTIPLLTPITR